MSIDTLTRLRGRGAVPLVLAALCSFLPVASTAEPANAGWSSRLYRAEDGLPASLIFAVAQDQAGFLWLGTASGLVRFDGLDFVTWGSRGEPPLPHPEVRSLLVDRDDAVWIGFNEGGVIACLRRGRLSTYTTEHGLPDGVVMPEIQDHEGTIWAAGAAGVAAFRAGRWHHLWGQEGLPASAASTVYEDHHGAVWVSTSDGVFRRPRGEHGFTKVLALPTASFVNDQAGRLLVADGANGLRPISEGGGSLQPPISRFNGNVVLRDRKNDLWVGSAYLGGLAWIDGRTNAGSPHRTITLSSELILALHEDTEGNIWAGTPRGLLRLYRSSVRKLKTTDHLPGDNVRVVARNQNDGVWLGTSAGLASVDLSGGLRVTSAPEPLGQLSIRTMSLASTGALWLSGTQDGRDLFGRLDGRRYVPLQWSANSAAGTAQAIIPDSQGSAWVCPTGVAGVFRWHEGQMTVYPVGGALERKFCTAGLEASDGRVWIGFDDGSVLEIKDGQNRIHARGRAGNPQARVCAIYEDRSRDIWVATTSGVSRYRDGAFLTLTGQNGLPGDNFSAVIEDDDGALWIGMSSGILRLTKEEVAAATRDRNRGVSYTQFDSSDGVSDTPACYAASTAARDKDGRIWFAGLNGAIVIDPSQISDKRPTVRPLIERVLVNGEPVTDLTAVALAPGTTRLEVNYTAVSLSAASKIRFRYRLDGFDAPWTDAGTRRQAFYTNLPPGTYRFVLEANLNGAAPSTASWDFTIQPAFYQTSSFYVFSGVLALCIGWTAWQLRLAALRQQFGRVSEERSRIAREIHDSILQSMAGVALQLEGLARQRPSVEDPVSGELKAISKDVKRHVSEARDAIWDLRSGAATGPLHLALRSLAEKVLSGSGVRLDAAVSGDPVPCEERVEEQVLKVAGEALRNVVAHANATHVRLHLAYEPAAVRLLIVDDGCGFVTDHGPVGVNGHWGLTGMRERAKRIGADLRIDSRSDAGTSVEMRIPRTS